MLDRAWLKQHQDELDKKMIDRNHRLDIFKLGYCLACGLPHGQRCEALTLAEAKAGLRAEGIA